MNSKHKYSPSVHSINTAWIRIGWLAILTLGFILFSCAGKAKQQQEDILEKEEESVYEDRITPVEPEEVGLLRGTEAPLFDPYTCDANLIFGDLEICSNPRDDGSGNTHRIVNVSDNSGFIVGEDKGCFFRGLIAEKLIFEQPEGEISKVFLYSQQGELEFSSVFAHELKVVDDQLIFWAQADPDKVEPKPGCFRSAGMEDSLILIEEYKLDLNTLDRIATGRFDCQGPHSTPL